MAELKLWYCGDAVLQMIWQMDMLLLLVGLPLESLIPDVVVGRRMVVLFESLRLVVDVEPGN